MSSWEAAGRKLGGLFRDGLLPDYKLSLKAGFVFWGQVFNGIRLGENDAAQVNQLTVMLTRKKAEQAMCLDAFQQARDGRLDFTSHWKSLGKSARAACIAQVFPIILKAATGQAPGKMWLVWSVLRQAMDERQAASLWQENVPDAGHFKDLLDFLGVDTSASEDELKQAYRRCRTKYHPDRNGDAKAAEHFDYLRREYERMGMP